MIFWFYIVASVFLNGFGQLMLKRGMTNFSSQATSELSIIYLLKMITTPLVFAGLASYGISMLVWLQILTKAEVSYAYPIVISLTFTLVLIGSFFFLEEELNLLKVAGVGIILIGIFVASMGRV